MIRASFRLQLFVTALAGFATLAAAAAPPAAPAPAPPSLAALGLDPGVPPMRALVERFNADRASLEHFHDVPGSDKVRNREKSFLEQWQQTLRTVDFAALDTEGRIDWVLFRNKLEFDLRELEHDARRWNEIAALLPFRETIVALEEDRRFMEPLDPRRAAEKLDAMRKQTEKLRKELDARRKEASASAAWPTTLVYRAAQSVDRLGRVLDQWQGAYAGYDPLFDWWVNQPCRQARTTLKDYAKFLRETMAGVKEEEDPVVGDPIGREALLDALAAEMIPYPPEELVQIAEKELAWCQARMLEASRAMGLGEDWPKALERVKNEHVEPGRQPALIRELADEAVQFLEARELVTIPPLCRETWRLEMMTPERPKVTPFFTGGPTVSVSFPTEGMSHEEKLMTMRGNNIHFSRATVHHELIPGHHLQGFMAARHRTERRLFRTPFLVEGWALHWEMLLWDLDFPRSPENRVGMLFWRMHRCARIIFSLNFHLGKMTAPEAIEFLVDKVGHERSNATAEVRRSVNGSYSPLYQAAYMVGGLQLRALHRELVGSGRMTERQFHDAVLRENAIPIEMIRAALTGQPPAQDYRPNWRFY